jgi:hypothetical protein
LPTLVAALCANPVCVEVGTKFVAAATAVGSILDSLSQKISELPPSLGYGQLLIEHGCPPFVARGLAALAVRHGKRRAAESARERGVFDALRFLGQSPRQKRATLARARFLLEAWNETSIVETVFNQAGISEVEFIRLLQAAVDGDVLADRLTELAAAAASRLTLPRGPKISAASAAHQFLLENCPNVSKIPRPRSWQTPVPWVDALTDATGREFGNADFDSRPARRRSRCRREATRKCQGSE